MARRERQQTFEYRTHGGARRGAGRKPNGARAGERHGTRPAVDWRVPLHVTMRIARGVPSLRAQRCMALVRRAFAGGRERFGFRLVHYAVQPDHLHLVVEAADRRALTRGARGLSVRIARLLNGGLGRTGQVFADRYHARPLRTPREVRRALAYVLLQARRHAAQRRTGMTTVLDACSSGAWFDGWSRGRKRDGPLVETVAPRTWLLAVGWRRHGLVDPAEVPGAPPLG
jgi:REP-associated tyrosine transposase